MISTLVRTIMNRPVAVLMITIMVAVAGLGALFLLPMDFYPPLSVPGLTIATTYGGLPAKEVRELITIPVEDTVSSLPGLKKISSSSLDGISIIELSFTWGTDIRQAGIQAREMADIASLELPEGASRPMVLPVNPTEKPVLYIGVFPRGTLTIPVLKRLCDREIKSLLQQAPGVGSIQILGGLDEEILIEPDPYRLGMYSLAFQTLAQAVQATNTEVPAGSIEQGTTEYIVKTESMIRTPQDISGIPLFTGKDAAGAILVRDIARVSRTTADRTSFLLRNGEEGIGMLVRAQGGYSPVSLSVNVRRAIRDIQNAYGCSLSLEMLSDSSYMIHESIRDLLVSGLAGILVAFIVILFFLRNLTASCIMTTSIPLSLLAAIALFPLTGTGINIMSIGGLAIGIGMLVDNSVVVLENLQRKADPAVRTSVVAATVEIAGSTIGSTITSLVVFLPLFFLPDLIGVVFRDLAWAVSCSLLASFIVSISVVPVLYCRFGSGETGVNSHNRLYRASLRMVYRRPTCAAITGVALLAAGVFSFHFLDRDWLNTPESSHYLVSLALPAGTTIEYQQEIARSTSLILSENSVMERCFFYGGGDYQDPYYITGKDPEHETLFCHCTVSATADMTGDALSNYFSGLFSGNDSISVTVTPDSLSVNDVLGINGSGIATFPVPGNEYNEALCRAERLKESCADPAVTIYPRASRPRITALPAQSALDALRLDNAAIARILGSYLFGVYAGFLDTPEGRIPIRIRLAKKHRDSPDTLTTLVFPLSEHASTTLAEAVTMEHSLAPPVYYRTNRQNVVYLDVPAENRETLSMLGRVVTDTDTEEWKNQTRTLLVLFFASIFLMYLLLGIQFNSFFLPVLLLAVLPFGFSGALTALFLSGKAITLNGILGSLVVIGVVVNNGIIFYDAYSRRITRPELALSGTYHGANDRIRAVSISFFTTFFALVPVALDVTKRNPQSAMATAIIGGISVSTLVSIYGFPVMFARYFARRKLEAPHAP